MTQQIATDIFNKLKGKQLQAFKMEILSIPHLEVGDKIEYTDQKGNTKQLYITEMYFQWGNKTKYRCQNNGE
jgi:hypothetical protein